MKVELNQDLQRIDTKDGTLSLRLKGYAHQSNQVYAIQSRICTEGTINIAEFH